MKNRTLKCWMRRAVLRLLYASAEPSRDYDMMRRLTTDFSDARFLALSSDDRRKEFAEVMAKLIEEGRVETVPSVSPWPVGAKSYKPRGLLEILAFTARD